MKNTPGVRDARVNFGASKITIFGAELSPEEVEKLGAFDDIKVVREDHEGQKKAGLWEKHRLSITTSVSLVLIILAFVMQWTGTSTVLCIGTFLAATLIGGWENFKKGFPALFRLDFNMNTLMSVAVAGAVAIGEWEEAAVVAFLFGVSSMLESYASEMARHSIRQLMELAPRTATVIRDGGEFVLPVEEIEVGDIIRVKPGEKIAMDGEIIRGSTTVNQSAITGESIPVEKGLGDEVYAGTMNQIGAIEVRVNRLAEDTTIAKMITMVEDAQEQRAPSQAFVDRFAKVYTPVVMLLAIGIALIPPMLFGALWQPFIYNALALLIVACPCALVVSTPVALVTSIGTAARHGVLIKGGIHLENAGALKAIALDKTGTLTRGQPEVTDILALTGQEEDEVLSLAASVEQYSEHPLAAAIVREAQSRKLSFKPAEEFQAIMGKGTQATVDEVSYQIGSPRLMEEFGVDVRRVPVQEAIRRLQEEGKTAMLMSRAQQVIAIIAVADTVRETSREAIRRLKESGIEKTIMLTGDHEATARAIAGQVGVDEYRAGLLPEDKVAAILELRETYGRIGMVGDGINDAPALAAATTGIAMGGAGTDAALETADIVLMADDLTKLPFTMRMSRAALRIIKQNTAFSIAVKVVATALIFPGWLTLWLAIGADMGASILVTLNGLRLIRIKSGGTATRLAPKETGCM